MILDLHAHSVKSDDGRAKVQNYCQWIKTRNIPIDGFVLTEHRQFDNDSDYSDLAAKHGLTILKGSEVETEYGHVLVFGVTEALQQAFDFTNIHLPLAEVLAACGFEYDGPAGHIGFKPRMMEDGRFKAAFTCAEGWGSFEQEAGSAKISLHYGRLEIQSVSLQLQGNSSVARTSHGDASIERAGKDIRLRFEQPITLAAGEALSMRL